MDPLFDTVFERDPAATKERVHEDVARCVRVCSTDYVKTHLNAALRLFQGAHAHTRLEDVQLAKERVRALVSAYEENGENGDDYRTVRRHVAENLMREIARAVDTTSLYATSAALDLAINPFETDDGKETGEYENEDDGEEYNVDGNFFEDESEDFPDHVGSFVRLDCLRSFCPAVKELHERATQHREQIPKSTTSASKEGDAGAKNAYLVKTIAAKLARYMKNRDKVLYIPGMTTAELPHENNDGDLFAYPPVCRCSFFNPATDISGDAAVAYEQEREMPARQAIERLVSLRAKR